MDFALLKSKWGSSTKTTSQPKFKYWGSVSRGNENKNLQSQDWGSMPTSFIKTPNYKPKTKRLEIGSFINESLLNCEDNEKFIYQGMLWRFHPGFGQNFIQKWCTVSRSFFNYYRNKWAANCFLENPLISIPVTCIESVEALSSPFLHSQLKPHNGRVHKKFQFEIILRNAINYNNLDETIPQKSIR
jgi:hypothetical protein